MRIDAFDPLGLERAAEDPAASGREAGRVAAVDCEAGSPPAGDLVRR
jgi:hypothetical protein